MAVVGSRFNRAVYNEIHHALDGSGNDNVYKDESVENGISHAS